MRLDETLTERLGELRSKCAKATDAETKAALTADIARYERVLNVEAEVRYGRPYSAEPRSDEEFRNAAALEVARVQPV